MASAFILEAILLQILNFWKAFDKMVEAYVLKMI